MKIFTNSFLAAKILHAFSAREQSLQDLKDSDASNLLITLTRNANQLSANASTPLSFKFFLSFGLKCIPLSRKANLKVELPKKI